jgi:Fe-Mn family superoxide dismutase
VPLLAFERQASIEAFLASIDWADVYARYQQAVERASEGHGAGHADLAGALVLDVRRKAVFEKAATRLPGADWRDPARVGTWSAEIPAGHPVVVYCIYGHEVGKATALRLRAAGIDARFLRGGIDGWQSAGRALEPKEATP